MSNKDGWRKLHKDLEAAGCELVYSKSGHIKVYYQGKVRYTMPNTSSDYRCLLNVRARLRRELGVAL